MELLILVVNTNTIHVYENELHFIHLTVVSSCSSHIKDSVNITTINNQNKGQKFYGRNNTIILHYYTIFIFTLHLLSSHIRFEVIVFNLSLLE